MTGHRSTVNVRRARLALALATVAVLAADVFMLVDRSSGYGLWFADYATIYTPAEMPLIGDLRQHGGRLELELDGPAASHYRLSAEPAARIDERGSRFVIEPSEHLHSLRLSPRDASAVSQAEHSLALRAAGGTMHVGSATVRVGQVPRRPLRELVADPLDYPPADLQAARALLAPLDLERAKSTTERFARVWLFLHRQLADHRGAPPPWLQERPAFEQYRLAVSGRANVYCGNIAQILTLFATAAGVSTRTVDALGRHGDVTLSAHALVEVFVPESGRFMYSDLTTSLFAVTAGREGPVLNTVQLTEVLRADAAGALFAQVPEAEGLVTRPLVEVGETLPLYFSPHAIYRFQTEYDGRHALLAGLARYLFPDEPAYSLTRCGSVGHWLKLLALLATAGLAIYWLSVIVRLVMAFRARRS